MSLPSISPIQPTPDICSALEEVLEFFERAEGEMRMCARLVRLAKQRLSEVAEENAKLKARVAFLEQRQAGRVWP